MHEEALHLFSLGDHCEQLGNQCNLAPHICFVSPLYLSFSYHVHDFIALQGSLCGFKRKETHPRFGSSFDETVILFDQIVEVFDLP